MGHTQGEPDRPKKCACSSVSTSALSVCMSGGGGHPLLPASQTASRLLGSHFDSLVRYVHVLSSSLRARNPKYSPCWAATILQKDSLSSRYFLPAPQQFLLIPSEVPWVTRDNRSHFCFHVVKERAATGPCDHGWGGGRKTHQIYLARKQENWGKRVSFSLETTFFWPSVEILMGMFPDLLL